MGCKLGRCIPHHLRSSLTLLAKGLLAGIAFLAGCDYKGGRAMYGIEPPPGDPTVAIVEFAYQPASPIEVGAGIIFTATLNKPLDAYLAPNSFDVTIGDAEHPIPHFGTQGIRIALSDDGGLYDELAGDRVYSGAIEWRAEYGTYDSLPVIAKLDWWDETPDVIVTGEPLQVVEGAGQ